jgi:hypothetical protein
MTTAYDPHNPATWPEVVNPAVLSPTEDQTFDAMWAWVTSLFDPSIAVQVFKGYQNMASTPYGTYVVISPAVKERLNQGLRGYVYNAQTQVGTVTQQRNTNYSWQIDVYGPQAADWADVISIVWRSNTAADALRGGAIVPLYADEPRQLNIVNGEDQYEARFMTTLFGQVNQTVTLAQQFATTATVQVLPPVDIVTP